MEIMSEARDNWKRWNVFTVSMKILLEYYFDGLIQKFFCPIEIQDGRFSIGPYQKIIKYLIQNLIDC
jgi:hypothetical protein